MGKHEEMKKKTRQAIIDTFWVLLEKKGLKKITVSCLMKETNYYRGTFYEYFQDIPDLVQQIEDEIINTLISQLNNKIKLLSILSLDSFSKECAAVVAKLDDKIFLLMSENGDSKFSHRLKNVFINEIMNHFDYEENTEYKDYIIAYCYSALIGIRMHWYETNKNISLEDSVKLSQKLILTGLLGSFNIIK